MRNLPASVKARWWAGWRGPPCWQAQDGWPQRLWTKVRVAARTGPLGAICLRRLLIMRWMTVQLAWHVHSNPRGSLVYSNYTRKSAKNHGCEEKIANRGKQVTQAQSKLRLAQLQRCDKSLVRQSCQPHHLSRPGRHPAQTAAGHGCNRGPLPRMTFAGRMRELLDLEVEILRLRFAGLELDLLALGFTLAGARSPR